MYPLLTNDRDLPDAQVLEAHKRQPLVESCMAFSFENRFSWITSDPKAEDLECFAGLTRRSRRVAK